MTVDLSNAVKLYFDRESRKAHPSGTFDKHRRWYPDDAEHCGCCKLIRRPSAAWPHSLNKHCRSIDHIARLCNVDLKELRRAVNRQKRINKLAQRCGATLPLTEQECAVCGATSICCDADDCPLCVEHCNHPSPRVIDGLRDQQRGE